VLPAGPRPNPHGLRFGRRRAFGADGRWFPHARDRHRVRIVAPPRPGRRLRRHRLPDGRALRLRPRRARARGPGPRGRDVGTGGSPRTVVGEHPPHDTDHHQSEHYHRNTVSPVHVGHSSSRCGAGRKPLSAARSILSHRNGRAPAEGLTPTPLRARSGTRCVRHSVGRVRRCAARDGAVLAVVIGATRRTSFFVTSVMNSKNVVRPVGQRAYSSVAYKCATGVKHAARFALPSPLAIRGGILFRHQIHARSR
jgi:hypothetical protein